MEEFTNHQTSRIQILAFLQRIMDSMQRSFTDVTFILLMIIIFWQARRITIRKSSRRQGLIQLHLWSVAMEPYLTYAKQMDNCRSLRLQIIHIFVRRTAVTHLVHLVVE